MQDPVRVEEAVGRHQVHARGGIPAGEQELEEARDGRFADGDRAGDADDEGGRVAFGLSEEGVPFGGSAAAPVDVELQQCAQGAVNRVDLGHVDGVAQRCDAVDVLLRERQGSAIGEAVPLGAIEARVGVGGVALVGRILLVRRDSRRGREWDGRGALGDAHAPIVPHMFVVVRT